MKNKNIMSILGIFMIFTVSGLVSAQGMVIGLPIDKYGVETSIQDYNGNIVSFFLSRTLQLTNLSEDSFKRNTSVYVTDATDCLSGDAIDIYDNDYYFQGIITNVGADYINFTPELDYSFEAGSIAKCGEWNLNSDGSTTPVEYTINPPLERSWDIESIGMQFQDNLDWDISTFGSRSALTNGFVVAVGDGDIKNLFLVYNNGGFLLRGGTIQDVAKAPAGLYGFSVDMEFETKYGSVLKLDGTLNESLRAINQDDLTSQTQIAFTVRGHYKDA